MTKSTSILTHWVHMISPKQEIIESWHLPTNDTRWRCDSVELATCAEKLMVHLAGDIFIVWPCYVSNEWSICKEGDK